jgi:shikimate kinase
LRLLFCSKVQFQNFRFIQHDPETTMTAATLELATLYRTPSDLMPPLTRQTIAATLPGVDRLVLAGFMGSGKTTIGALLAERLGWKFLDLDVEIERRAGRRVPQIFAESGEAQFRRMEASALASVLGRRRLVLALGGGAPEELGNRLLLEQTPHTAVIYLAAPFATLVERCVLRAGSCIMRGLRATPWRRRRWMQRRRCRRCWHCWNSVSRGANRGRSGNRLAARAALASQ